MMSTAIDIDQPCLSLSPRIPINPRQRLDGLQPSLPSVDSNRSSAEGKQASERSDVDDPVQQVNQVMRSHGVQFEISEPPGERLITRIVDRETGELIRQIPAEELVRLAERLAQRLTEIPQGQRLSKRGVLFQAEA